MTIKRCKTCVFRMCTYEPQLGLQKLLVFRQKNGEKKTMPVEIQRSNHNEQPGNRLTTNTRRLVDMLVHLTVNFIWNIQFFFCFFLLIVRYVNTSNLRWTECDRFSHRREKKHTRRNRNCKNKNISSATRNNRQQQQKLTTLNCKMNKKKFMTKNNIHTHRETANKNR